MNNANETRAEFNHLIAVARDTGCAIVIIAHMNKAKDTSPLYRTNGSIDIAGAARSILAVSRTSNKQNPAERYLVQVKSNLAPIGSAILFEVADKDVNFLDELELSAEDAFSASAPRMGRPNAREEAATDFIRPCCRTADGWLPIAKQSLNLLASRNQPTRSPRRKPEFAL